MCAPTTHAPNMCYVCVSGRGGQGPCGGCTLVYTHTHTDQENVTVNHYTHKVVYTVLCMLYYNTVRAITR